MQPVNMGFNMCKEDIIWICLFLSIVFAVFFAPTYRVYSAKMLGEADLIRAHNNAQIQLLQAKSDLDAAESRARTISIIGEAVHKYPDFRSQEFIDAISLSLREGKINQVVYVPTEANVPINTGNKK